MALCIFLTLYIFLACYTTVDHDSTPNTPAAILAAFAMTCSQVVLTELTLGLMGLLHKELLFLCNIFISTLVLYFRIRMYGFGMLRISVSRSLNINFLGAFDGYSKTLLLLLTFSYAIIITAVYMLPPRGIDDLAYHLPSISEYAQSHTIKLLPVEIREAFAYPQNAELLFLWPLIFSGSMKLIDGINVPFIFVSVLSVYALLQNFSLTKKNTLFFSILYALCPVVMMQAGVNYIDVILSLFLVLSLYFTVLFLQQSRNCHAWYAGLSIGMACGMKYTAFFITLPFQALILIKLFRGRPWQAIGFAVTVGLMGGWWYLRNAAVLGNPFYPMNIFVSGMGFMGNGEANPLMDLLSNAYEWFGKFPLSDIGIGTFDGGFGLVFWGLGFPSWICISLYYILRPHKRILPIVLTLMQLPMGFLILLLVPKHMLVFNGRFALFIVVIGLLSLSLVFDLVKDNFYKHAIKITCIVFSLAAICLLASTKKPSYRFDTALSSPYRGTVPSEYLFPMDTEPVYARLRYVWQLLDYLTMDERPGINCYVASVESYLALTPIYGSKLQNNPITIGDDVPSHPEAFIYLYYSSTDSAGENKGQELFYPNTRILKEEVLSDREYAVIANTELGCLIMSKAYLSKPGKYDVLRNYYAATWPDAVKDAARLKPLLGTGIPLVTADEIAYGLLYEELGKGRLGSVMLIPAGYEEHVARTQHLSACYTLDKPLRGYIHTKIETVKFSDKQIDIFLNQAI